MPAQAGIQEVPANYFVYILASKRNGTLYIDVTEAAITREKQMKKWNRAWKIEIIEKVNPDRKDLYGEIAV